MPTFIISFGLLITGKWYIVIVIWCNNKRGIIRLFANFYEFLTPQVKVKCGKHELYLIYLRDLSNLLLLADIACITASRYLDKLSLYLNSFRSSLHYKQSHYCQELSL